jgi:hypothetical protein
MSPHLGTCEIRLRVRCALGWCPLGRRRGALRLRTSFEPVPLYTVLSRRGFWHSGRQLAADDWEVIFSRSETSEIPAPRCARAQCQPPLEASQSDGMVHFDVSDLVPPEPMVSMVASRSGPTRMRSTSGLATQYAPPIDLPFRFMATALAWLAVLTLMYPWQTPLLLGSFYDPRLLTFVHINTLGVIAATIFGASYQLLPVVLGVPIASVKLARLSGWLYVPALPLFLIGLSQTWLLPLAIGGSLLVGAVALYVGMVFATLRRAYEHDVVFWHLAVSVLGLAAGATLGLLLAFSKGDGILGGLTLPILAAHATLMFGGWVTPMLMGVGYRLVGMFTLSEDRLHEPWAWASLACSSAGAWGLAAGLLASIRTVEIVGAAGLFIGMIFFVGQLIRLYRVRRRRQFDVHIPFALTAVCFGLAAVGLIFFGLATGRAASEPIWIAAGWLAIAGWAAWSSGVLLEGFAVVTQSELLAHAAAAGLTVGAFLFLSNAIRVGTHWRRRTLLEPSPQHGLATSLQR